METSLTQMKVDLVKMQVSAPMAHQIVCTVCQRVQEKLDWLMQFLGQIPKAIFSEWTCIS